MGCTFDGISGTWLYVASLVISQFSLAHVYFMRVIQNSQSIISHIYQICISNRERSTFFLSKCMPVLNRGINCGRPVQSVFQLVFSLYS
jgi:hypothetical protein